MESLEAAYALVGRRDWPALLEWIERSFWQAEVFGATLAGWRSLFERIPAEVLAQTPALALYRLRLLAGTDPEAALAELEAAHADPALADDALLRCEYAAVAVNCLLTRAQDTEAAATWAARLAGDRAAVRRYPSAEVELRIKSGAVVAGLLTGTGRDETPGLIARCVELLKGRVAPGVRAAGFDALMITASMGYELQLITWVLRQLERFPAIPWLGPKQRARHIDALAGGYSIVREFDRHRRVLDEGIEAALAEGDTNSARMFMFGLAQGSLARREIEAAEAAIRRYEPYLDAANPNDLTMDAGNRALLETLKEHWEQAEAHARDAARYAELAGLPAYEICAFRTIHGSSLLNLQRYAEGADCYERSADVAPGEMKTIALANVKLARALVATDGPGPGQASAIAAGVFTGLAPEQFRRLFGFARADRALARAVHLAILGGVPADTLRPLVEARGLAPPAGAGLAWPWVARVRLLGGFEVEGLAIDPAASRRAANKPIELLQLLGAFAPQAMASERVADALWPDADADLALNNLDVTLVRLRKRVGRDDVVVRRAGRLALGTHVIWVDCAELGALAAGSEGGAAAARRALELYRGPLLPDVEAPWVAARRSVPARQAMLVLERGLADMLVGGDALEAARIIDALGECGLPAEAMVLSAFERVALMAPQRLPHVVPPLVSAVESDALGAPARKLRAFAARRNIGL